VLAVKLASAIDRATASTASISAGVSSAATAAVDVRRRRGPESGFRECRGVDDGGAAAAVQTARVGEPDRVELVGRDAAEQRPAGVHEGAAGHAFTLLTATITRSRSASSRRPRAYTSASGLARWSTPARSRSASHGELKTVDLGAWLWRCSHG